MKMSTRKLSKKQETTVAKAVGGRTVANSGATMFEKGDAVTDDFLLECKTQEQEKKSFTIKKEWVETLKNELFGTKKRFWAVVFNFGGYGNKENYYIISERCFNDLQTYYKQQEEEE